SARSPTSSSGSGSAMAEAFFWPALVAYGEAALAYSSPRFSGLGTWGVRVGWLAQTALLALQAVRVDGFPWSSWAGSLNLFVWLVVGTYLIWGCRPRFRLLGLTVMPLAVVLFLAARIGGGTAVGERSHYGNVFLVLHVGLVLAAFAGFTLAAGLSGLYLVEDRRVGGLRGVPRPPPDRPHRRAPRARRLRARHRRPGGARREPLLRLSLVGISHHVAPVELRERVALPLDRAASLARRLGDAVCLSTCNRTEVYLAGGDESRALASLEELAGEPLRAVAYRLHDEAAAVHLFRV